jgi:hypothetical protein
MGGTGSLFSSFACKFVFYILQALIHPVTVGAFASYIERVDWDTDIVAGLVTQGTWSMVSCGAVGISAVAFVKTGHAGLG